jgi:septum formation protein
MVFPRLILASQSPRRRELLGWLGFPFETLDVSIDESPLPGEGARDHVLRIAEAKARSASKDLDGDFIVISADTVVVDRGEILGKPEDAAHAERILQRLSGHDHFVDTGFTFYNLSDHRMTKGLCESQVSMRLLTGKEIRTYVLSGDPLDKAGAYAIQNREFNLVPEFSGCMANVMGLPLCHLKRTYLKQGIDMPVDLTRTCRENLGYACRISARIFAGDDIG